PKDLRLFGSRLRLRLLVAVAGSFEEKDSTVQQRARRNSSQARSSPCRRTRPKTLNSAAGASRLAEDRLAISSWIDTSKGPSRSIASRRHHSLLCREVTGAGRDRKSV